MKFNKKFLSIFFIAILAVVLVACGGTTTAAPTTQAPTTQAPTTQAPTTQAPTTQAPTTQAPTTEAPTTLPINWATIEQSLRTEYSATLEDEEFVAVANLTLISVIGEANITWSSSNTTYLGHDGTVIRPAYSIGNQTVILTATLEIGGQTHEVMFFVTIGALAKTDQERANEVLDKVMVFPFKEKWSSADSDSLDFLTTATDADGVSYDVTWDSSHPQYIATDGTIVQPDDEDVVVTMTATVTIGGVDFTRTKNFTVAKMEEGTPVSTIAEAVALGEDTYVKILGVTVIAKHTSGDVFFTDGVDILYIYTPTFQSVIGGVYDISGIVDIYYNAPQLAGSDTQPLRAEASTAEVKSAPIQVMAGILDVIADQSMPTPENLFKYQAYTVTAKVYYNSAWGNYSVFLVPTNYDFDAPLADGASQPNGDSIMIYYKSDMTVLQAFHGEEITIDIITQGWRSDKSVWYANFFGTAADVEINIADDQEAVNTALAALSYPGTIVEDTTLVFPESLYGVTLTYTSSDVAIDVTTGAVDAASQTTQITVTLTVDAERGTATGQKVFTIKVGELPVSTIAEALATSSNTLVKVRGIVIDFARGTVYIQDATGNIALYVSSSELNTLIEANLGNVIEITGTRDTYNGLNQLRVQTAVYVEDSVLPIPTNLDNLVLDNTNLLPYQSQVIELTGMLVTNIDTYNSSSGYTVLTFTLQNLRNGTTINARWDNRLVLPSELNTFVNGIEEGDIINITGVLSWFNAPQMVISSNTLLSTTTDAEKLAADAATIPATIETTSGATEMAPLVGPYGSTFVWDATEITNAGGTFDPITGEITYPEVLVDTVYNVTGTASLGSETPVNLSLAITVLAMTDAEKLAAAIADTGIDEDCDGYQVVALPLTGLYGTTISWVVISGEATLDVDGTTLTYAQAGAVADVVLEATFENGLESQAVQYTVTVTPATIVTDLSTLHTMTGEVYDVTGDVFVQGIITAIDYRTIFIQDANGVGFTLYNTLSTVSGVVQNPNNLAIGDEVVFYGTLAAYNSARQISGAAFKEKLSSENPLIVTPMTADQIIALTPADAGKLISFEGFVIQSWDGYNVNLSVIGTSETITVSLRGYANGTPWLKDVFDVNDVLPSVNIIFYNIYKLGEPNEALNFSYITIEAGNQAFEGYEATLTDALAYTYVDYEYHYETIAVDGYSIHLEYLQSTLLEANPTDMYEGIMFDLARFLGSIYRVEGSVTSLEYDGVEYTWSESLGLQGSNWVQTDGTTTLVSVIVTDFTLGNITDGIVVKLMDGSIYSANLNLTFNVTMDLDDPIIDTIEGAILYEYTGDSAYTYSYETSAYADFVVSTVYLQDTIDTEGTVVIMNDMARYLGALYRVQDSAITTLVYKGVDYTWNLAGTLKGSNWEDSVGTTLVSVITDDFIADPLMDTVTLIMEDVNGYGLSIDLTFSVEGEVVEPTITELFISEYIEGGSFNKAIEIFNGTGADVDLTGYSVSLYSNGSETATATVTLSGTLASGDVLVIYHGSAVAGISDNGDILDSNVANFNGDDAIALLKDGVIIDVFGIIGTDPGSSWVVGTGTTANFTLVRKSTVTGPTTTWDPNEWDVYPQDNFDFIGSHTVA